MNLAVRHILNDLAPPAKLAAKPALAASVPDAFISGSGNTANQP